MWYRKEKKKGKSSQVQSELVSMNEKMRIGWLEGSEGRISRGCGWMG